jgi:protein SCO1/2
MLCNLVLEGLVRGLERLEWTPGDEFDIVTVSIDPREGPALAQTKQRAVLGAYGRPQAVAGWHFLTADAAAIEALAESVGFSYRFVPETGEYAHGAALFVLTPEGRTSRYLFGVDHDPQTLRLSLVEAAEGKIGSPLDQFLLYCYRYDAAEGRYVPIAWRLMRLGGILTVMLLGGTLFTLWLREARQRRAVA